MLRIDPVFSLEKVGVPNYGSVAVWGVMETRMSKYVRVSENSCYRDAPPSKNDK
jgi:hypothetical protein